MPELRPYQQQGAEWLAGRSRAMLLDAPGLGKTPQVIIGAKLAQVERPVVICPAIAARMWLRRWDDWWPGGPTPIVTSYDTVVRNERMREHIRKLEPDLLVADECHYLKNPDSARTRHFYGWMKGEAGLASAAWRVWLLTGTPTPNWPDEWYPHIRGLWPELQPPLVACQRAVTDGYANWRNRYCAQIETTYGKQIVGARKEYEQELVEMLRPICLRRQQAEVLADLPELVWGDLLVDVDEARGQLEKAMATPVVMALREALEVGGDFHTMEAALASVRRLIGTLKAPTVAEVVAEELRAGAYKKVVLFAYHRDVITALQRELLCFGVSTITGSTGPGFRQVAQDEFQYGNNMVFIGQITACATAIDLTAADQCVIVEPSWVPDENLQAVKRLHRFGQTRRVFARFAALAGSIDDTIAQVLLRKQRANLLQEIETK